MAGFVFEGEILPLVIHIKFEPISAIRTLNARHSKLQNRIDQNYIEQRIKLLDLAQNALRFYRTRPQRDRRSHRREGHKEGSPVT